MNVTVATADITGFESTTPGYVDSKQPFSLFLLIQLIVGILGILGNSLVCIVFLSRRSLRNQTNLLITNQAFIDLLSSVLIIFYPIYWLSPFPPPGPSNAPIILTLYCYLFKSQFLLFSSFSISTFNLTVIALERYVAITYPLAYRKTFARRHVKYLIAVLWFAAPVLQYLLMFTTVSLRENVCVIGWAPASVGLLLFLWEYAAPVCTMVFCFVSILRKFRSVGRAVNHGAEPTSRATVSQRVNKRQQTNNTAITSGPTQTFQDNSAKTASGADGDRSNGLGVESYAAGAIPQNSVSSQPSVAPQNPLQSVNRSANRVTDVRRRNVTTTLLVVFALFIVCWSPNQLAFFQANLGGSLKFQGYFYQFTVALVICNTCVNPFIYALRHKAYKERLGELYGSLKGKCCH